VVSFGQPWSSHLLGLDLANRLGLPFIAHFSDLWADSPFVERDPLSRRYAQAKQEAVFRRASRILVPFQALGRELTKNAGPQVQQKLGVINPCFEPGIYPEAGEPPSPERVIRYLGTFYSLRSPAILVHSLAILAGRRPDLLNGVAFELIGDGGESVREAPGFAELPPGLVRFHPQVSYGRSLALMKGADALLNLEAAQTPQFPSKLVDYIGSGRPILGIVPPGLSERTIRELGGWTAHPRDPEGVAAMLADYLAAPSPASPWGGDEVRRGFEAAAVARRFDEIVREAAAGAPTG
jgi:glycosyltransferase involved in cell wall biosynthesis